MILFKRSYSKLRNCPTPDPGGEAEHIRAGEEAGEKTPFFLLILAFALFYYGSTAPVAAESTDDLIIEHGRRDSREIAITFDA